MSYIIHIQKPPFQMTISAPSSAKHCLFLHHCHMQLGTSSFGWKASDVQGHSRVSRQLAWFNARAAIAKSIFLPTSTNATSNLLSRAWGPAQLLEPASAPTQVAAKETASIYSICLPMETTYVLLRRNYQALRPKAQCFSQWQKQWCSSQKGKAFLSQTTKSCAISVAWCEWKCLGTNQTEDLNKGLCVIYWNPKSAERALQPSARGEGSLCAVTSSCHWMADTAHPKAPCSQWHQDFWGRNVSFPTCVRNSLKKQITRVYQIPHYNTNRLLGNKHSAMQISLEAFIQNACISPGAHKHQSHQSHVCNVIRDQSITACVPPLSHLSLTPSQLLQAPWPLSYPFVAFICVLEWPVFVVHVASQTILLQAGFNSLPPPHTTVGREGESVCGWHSCGCPVQEIQHPHCIWGVDKMRQDRLLQQVG